jgi:hypothetical protein
MWITLKICIHKILRLIGSSVNMSYICVGYGTLVLSSMHRIAIRINLRFVLIGSCSYSSASRFGILLIFFVLSINLISEIFAKRPRHLSNLRLPLW